MMDERDYTRAYLELGSSEAILDYARLYRDGLTRDNALHNEYAWRVLRAVTLMGNCINAGLSGRDIEFTIMIACEAIQDYEDQANSNPR